MHYSKSWRTDRGGPGSVPTAVSADMLCCEGVGIFFSTGGCGLCSDTSSQCPEKDYMFFCYETLEVWHGSMVAAVQINWWLPESRKGSDLPEPHLELGRETQSTRQLLSISSSRVGSSWTPQHQLFHSLKWKTLQAFHG